MKVEQVYELANQSIQQVLGETAVLEKDLSNLADIGKQFDKDHSDNASEYVDNYVRSLLNRIGKVIFVNRVYKGNAPSLMRDSWEYGSIVQKIRGEVKDAVKNESWDLQDGKTVDPYVISLPRVYSKFFNKRVTFEVDLTVTHRQVKESFRSADELNAFFSMLTNEVDKKMTMALDAQIMDTISYAMVETIKDAFPDTTDYSGKSTIRAINLFHLYKEDVLKTSNPSAEELAYINALQPQDVITDPEFIRFASYYMGLVRNRMSSASKLFNIGGTAKFTSSEHLHVIMLAEFKAAADSYLQSDTFNNKFTELPSSDTVPFWSGSGADFGFESTSKINATTIEGEPGVEMNGILAVMFDRDALGVCNLNRRVTTANNAKGEYINTFHKAEAGYYIDLDENFVMFYVA